MSKPFDITDVTYLKNIKVGNTDPNNLKSDEEIQQQTDELNKWLSASPKGIIVSTIKNFAVYTIGEHQVVLSSIHYQIGYKRKPSGLGD